LGGSNGKSKNHNVNNGDIILMINTDQNTCSHLGKQLYDVYCCEKGHVSFVNIDEDTNKCICGSRNLKFYGQAYLEKTISKEFKNDYIKK